jgi:hypothetical protein
VTLLDFNHNLLGWGNVENQLNIIKKSPLIFLFSNNFLSLHPQNYQLVNGVLTTSVFQIWD